MVEDSPVCVVDHTPSEDESLSETDELDYDEGSPTDKDHTHSPHSITSGEEGEIKEDSPYRRISPPTSSHRQQPSVRSSSNYCRHYIQGRCDWGENCRFSHADGGFRSSVDPRSHKPHPFYDDRRPHRFSNAHFSHLTRYRRSPRFMIPPPHYYPPFHLPLYPPTPSPWDLPCPIGNGIVGSVQKFEEDQKWHRLRTSIRWSNTSSSSRSSSGSDSEDDLKARLKNRKGKKHSERTQSKKKKKERKKQQRNDQSSSSSDTETVDPLEKSNDHRPGGGSEEEKKMKKRGKKTKEKKKSYVAKHYQDRIQEELEEAETALKQRKRHHPDDG